MIEAIGLLAGCLTLLTYVPQSIKTIRTRKTRDLSLGTYVLLAASALLWVVFGLFKDLHAVWVTNTVVFALGSIILTMKLKQTEVTK